MVSRRSAGSMLEFTSAARTPRANNWSTWSFMSAMSGLTTMQAPPIASAGSW